MCERDPIITLRQHIIFAHALVAALALYYSWRDEYDVAEQYERPCYWTWRRMHEKTLVEWRRK